MKFLFNFLVLCVLGMVGIPLVASLPEGAAAVAGIILLCIGLPLYYKVENAAFDAGAKTVGKAWGGMSEEELQNTRRLAKTIGVDLSPTDGVKRLIKQHDK